MTKKTLEKLFMVLMCLNILITLIWRIIDFPGVASNAENVELVIAVALGLANFIVTFRLISVCRKPNEGSVVHRLRVGAGASLVLLVGAFTGGVVAKVTILGVTNMLARENFTEHWRCVSSNSNRYNGTENKMERRNGDTVVFRGYPQLCPIGSQLSDHMYVVSGRRWSKGWVITNISKLEAAD